MSTAVQPRRPAGSSTGGQYAESVRAEVDLELPTHDSPLAAFPDDADPGQAPQVSVGSRTPWGTADHVKVAPGATFVSTASHGGVRLSPERNAHIPLPLRQASGWYDEDDGSIVVGVFHPDLWPGSGDEIRDTDIQRLKDHYPDEFEEITGVVLGPGDSWSRAREAEVAQREATRQQWAGDLVTTGSADHGFLPDGFGAVEAERRTTGERRVLLCGKDFWSSRGISDVRTPVRVESGMVDITDIVSDWERATGRTEPPPVPDLGFDPTRLTPTQRERAVAELSTRYRYPDGSVSNFADGLIRQGAFGKRVSNFGGKAAYTITLPDSRIQQVSKATFDSLTGLPDLTDPQTPLSLELSAAGRAAQRAPRDAKARQRLADARAAYEAHEASESERYRALRADFQARVRERMTQ